jgi:Mlc titration factor MtfA (ptsG expression regulator)
LWRLKVADYTGAAQARRRDDALAGAAQKTLAFSGRACHDVRPWFSFVVFWMLKILKRWFAHKPDAERAVASIPVEVWADVEARLPFLARLPATERPRLRALTLAFLAEKKFYGAHGFYLTDRIVLTIALQACLLILNRGLSAYRGWVGVVVYPGEFIVPRSVMDEGGVVHEYDDVLVGEAWPGGPVLVSWFDDASAEMNVVIHEFAHKLDMADDGVANGLPPLPAHMSARRWAAVWGDAYRALCAQVGANQKTALDPYAAEDPSEFFAVASEVFFESPWQLRAAFPAVYEQLAMFYGLDPCGHPS